MAMCEQKTWARPGAHLVSQCKALTFHLGQHSRKFKNAMFLSDERQPEVDFFLTWAVILNKSWINLGSWETAHLPLP